MSGLISFSWEGEEGVVISTIMMTAFLKRFFISSCGKICYIPIIERNSSINTIKQSYKTHVGGKEEF